MRSEYLRMILLWHLWMFPLVLSSPNGAWESIALYVLCGSVLVMILWIDYRQHRIEKSKLILLAGTIWFTLPDSMKTITVRDSVQGMIPGMLMLSAWYLYGKKGLGTGDFRMMIVAGMILGERRGIDILVIGCLTAIPEGISIRCLSQNSDAAFAWGPYLCLGIWIDLLKPEILLILMKKLACLFCI